VLESLEVRVVLAALANPADSAVQVALVVPENLADPAVQAVLAVPENPAVPAVRVVLAVPENPVVRAVRVALAVLENQVGPAALARQVVAVLPSQVGVVEKEAQTRSVDINRLEAAVAVAPSLAAVGALLKRRAAGVEVA
jgi:hypothetical protein